MAKKTDEEIAEASAKKAGEIEPRMRKTPVVINYDWALNPSKLGLATTYVDNTTSGLSAEERHDAIKARYIELKGRLPGEKRHKDGMHNSGTPRPTSAQAIAFDEGGKIEREQNLAPDSLVDDDDDDEIV